MRIARWIFAGLGLIAAYLVGWPIRVDPVAWSPPEAPTLDARYRPNTFLARTDWLAKGTGIGPEAIAIDGAGSIYAGVKDGRVLRLSSDGTRVDTFATTAGRPLGLAFDRAAVGRVQAP